MIHIVSADNRHLFHRPLMEMHRQRKRVFVDAMGWPLRQIAGAEIDDFDCAEALYLIEMNAAARAVTGSVRLLPTDRPHLLSELFAGLCITPCPRGGSVWEATRFCPAPEIPKGAARRALLMRMIGAIMETALIFGIERVVFVASAALAPLAVDAGWRVAALGPAQRIGRDRLRAFVAEIDAAGLREVRRRHGVKGPLTRFMADDFARAA